MSLFNKTVADFSIKLNSRSGTSIESVLIVLKVKETQSVYYQS